MLLYFCQLMSFVDISELVDVSKNLNYDVLSDRSFLNTLLVKSPPLSFLVAVNKIEAYYSIYGETYVRQLFENEVDRLVLCAITYLKESTDSLNDIQSCASTLEQSWKFLNNCASIFEILEHSASKNFKSTNHYRFSIDTEVQQSIFHCFSRCLEESASIARIYTCIITASLSSILLDNELSLLPFMKDLLALLAILRLDSKWAAPAIIASLKTFQLNLLSQRDTNICQVVDACFRCCTLVTSKSLLMDITESYAIENTFKSWLTENLGSILDTALAFLLPLLQNEQDQANSQDIENRIRNLWLISNILPSGGPLFAKTFQSAASSYLLGLNGNTSTPSKSGFDEICSFLRVIELKAPILFGTALSKDFVRLSRQSSMSALNSRGVILVGDEMANLAQHAIMQHFHASIAVAEPGISSVCETIDDDEKNMIAALFDYATSESKKNVFSTDEIFDDFARVLRASGDLSKVAFETRHRVLMSRRALKSLLLSSQAREFLVLAESRLIACVASQCGSSFTIKAEGILKDLSTPLSPLDSASKSLVKSVSHKTPPAKRIKTMSQSKEETTSTSVAPQMHDASKQHAVSLAALNQAVWPFASAYRASALLAKGGDEEAEGPPLVSPFAPWLAALRIPPFFKYSMDELMQHYLGKYNGRVLVLCPEMTRVEVSDKLRNGRSIICSALQACLLVNGQVKENDSWIVRTTEAGFHGKMSQREVKRVAFGLVQSQVLVAIPGDSSAWQVADQITQSEKKIVDVLDEEYDAKTSNTKGLAWLGEGVRIAGLEGINAEEEPSNCDLGVDVKTKSLNSSGETDSIQILLSSGVQSAINESCEERRHLLSVFGGSHSGGGVDAIVQSALPQVIDACVVRTLKSERQVTLDVLLKGVMEVVGGKVKQEDVMDRLKTLEDREFCALSSWQENNFGKVIVKYVT